MSDPLQKALEEQRRLERENWRLTAKLDAVLSEQKDNEDLQKDLNDCIEKCVVSREENAKLLYEMSALIDERDAWIDEQVDTLRVSNKKLKEENARLKGTVHVVVGQCEVRETDVRALQALLARARVFVRRAGALDVGDRSTEAYNFFKEIDAALEEKK